MLNLFIAVLLEYYQREQDATAPFLSTDDNDTFDQIWTEFVGREPKKPNVSSELNAVRELLLILCLHVLVSSGYVPTDASTTF